MERFSIVDRRLFQWFEADRISEALSSAIRHITLTTLISETPIVAKVLTTEVVLRVLVALIDVALMVLLTVLNIDDNINTPRHTTSIFEFSIWFLISTKSTLISHIFIDFSRRWWDIFIKKFYQLEDLYVQSRFYQDFRPIWQSFKHLRFSFNVTRNI